MLRSLVQVKRTTLKPGKKKGRSGGALLLVVIIMAIALILITSALSITTAARNRYYNSALTDQATITASSVVRTIGAAVEKGDITVAEIEGLAKINAKFPVTTAASASKTAGSSTTSNAVAPGLKNDTTQSYTTVTVKNVKSSTGEDLIQVTVETGLDINGNATSKAQKESVYLKKITPAPPAGAFSSLLRCGVEGSVNNFENVEIGTKPTGQTTESNYIVLNGKMGISNSGGGSQSIYSDVIFTGPLTTGAGNTYTGNVVFYGKNASINADGGGSGIWTLGKMLFLGDPTAKQSVWTNSAGAPTTVTSSFGLTGAYGGIYLSNTVLQYGVNDGMLDTYSEKGNPKLPNKTGIYADNTSLMKYVTNNYSSPNGGAVFLSTTANKDSYYTPATTTIKLTDRGGIYAAGANDAAQWIKDLKAEAEKINNANMVSSIIRTLPDPAKDSTFYDTYGIAYDTVAEVTANATELKGTELTAAVLSKTCTDNAYYINAAANSSVGNDCDSSCSFATQTKFIFDLKDHDITVYIFGPGSTLTFGSGLFQFVNGGVHTGRIVLMDSVNLYLTASYCAFDTGIIGTNHVPTGVDAHTKVNYVAPLQKPFLYIYGIRNNRIYADQFATLEGYIGLYGEFKITGTGDEDCIGGKLVFNNQPYFYGRPEASVILNLGGNPMLVKYCPSPTEDSSGGGTAKAYYTVSGYTSS